MQTHGKDVHPKTPQEGRFKKSTRQSNQLPKNWPTHLPYLRLPSYSKKLTAEAMNVLISHMTDLPSGEEARQVVAPYSNVRITPIKDERHPAHGQYGLFASQSLHHGAFILSYLGYVHDHSETDETSDYDLSLDRDQRLSVDASQVGNEARFINDYRGIANAPNAEFKDIYIDLGNGKIEKRVGIFVLRAGKSNKNSGGIPKGREILVSYGKGFWNERTTTQEI